MINTTTLKINFNNFENNYHQNSTQTIRFRTKNNIINHIFEYFNFIPKNPLKNNILLNIEINAIYSRKIADDKDFETVLQEIKDQYPIMFNAETKNNSTGGGGTVPRKKSNNNISGMGKRLAEQRKQNNSIASNNSYFN